MFPLNDVYFVGKINFYRKEDKNNIAYDFDIEKTQIHYLEYFQSIIDFEYKVKLVLDDSLETFRKPILSKFLGYFSFNFGPNSLKIGGDYNLKIYRYGNAMNRRAAFYAAPEIFVDGLFDNSRISFKKGTLIKKVVEDLFAKVGLNYQISFMPPYDSQQLEWDVYYYGNVIDFLRNTILPHLDPFGVILFSPKKLIFSPLTFSEKEIFKIFSKNLKSEDRAFTETKYSDSLWSRSTEGEENFDSLNYDSYYKIDVLKGEKTQENFPNDKFCVTAPYFTTLSQKNIPFVATNVELRRMLYNIFLKKYSLHLVRCVNELQPWLYPGSNVRLYPVLESEKDDNGESKISLMDHFYRGTGIIASTSHILKEEDIILESQLDKKKFLGITKIEIFKPGSFTGETHKFKTITDPVLDPPSPIQEK